MRVWGLGRAVLAGALAMTVALSVPTAALAVAHPSSHVLAGHEHAAVSSADVSPAVYPLRSDPGYATPHGYGVRLTPGDGSTDTPYSGITTPVGSRLLWGDWWHTGEQSPAVFSSGHWSFYRTAAGVSRRPDATLSYGTAGDRPVVGDFDGDGTTDIAVVRRGVWYVTTDLHLTSGAQPAPHTLRRFSFGSPSAQPVAGDWDGDGRAGVGVDDHGRWTLRPAADADHRHDSSLAFGRSLSTGSASSAIAVSGDWDGDGRSTPGIVTGSTWHLRDSRGGTRSRRISRPAASWPSAMVTSAGPSGTACPTASARFAAPPATVVPSALLGSSPATDSPGSRAPSDSTAPVRQAFADAQHYLLTTQYEHTWAARLRASHYVDVRGMNPTTEYAIRLPAMSALAISIALSTGAYDPASTGMSVTAAQHYVDELVGSIACENDAVTPGGWGRVWESAHWTALTAAAAWLVWPDLSPQTRAYVTAMLVDESDDQSTAPFETWTDSTGAVSKPGDTRAEESAWNANLLGLATAMMPDWSHRAAYEQMAVELDTSSYSTPSDQHSDTLVNGVPLSTRTRQGTNALEDGTVINHGRLQPDYMANVMHLWWSADFAQLAGQSVPEAAFHHAQLVYGAFSTKVFEAGAPSASGIPGKSYVAPGGVIYRDDGTRYYPEGDDWGTDQRAPFVDLDAHAWLYGLDHTAAMPADTALSKHVDRQLQLVASSGATDGRSYSPDPAVAARQFDYPGREEFVAEELGMSWLALYLNEHGSLSIDDSTYAMPTTRPGALGPAARAHHDSFATATP